MANSVTNGKVGALPINANLNKGRIVVASSSKSNARKRWFDILSYAFIAAIVVELLAGLPISSAQSLFRLLGFRSSGAALALASILVVFALLPTAFGRWRAFLGWHHFWQYPPIALAGILGTIVVVLVSHFAPSLLSWIFGEASDLPLVLGDDWTTVAVWLLVIGLFYTAGAIVVSLLGPSKRRGDDSPLAAADREQAIVSPIVTDFAHLTEWLSHDDEINDPTRALFDHPTTARRIANRILASDAPDSTTAIIGNVGAGKSTLVALIEKHCQQTELAAQITLKKVSLWGHETPEAAARSILATLLQALGERVPTIALTGMPAHYARAMRGFHAGRTLAAFFDDTRSLSEILEDFDHVATCISWRFVLCVEDLERFAEIGGQSSKQSGNDPMLGPIRALLYRLDSLPSVTVLVATTSLSLATFDVDKIARFVETIPQMTKEQVGEILSCFRDGCLEMMKSKNQINSATSYNGPDIGLGLPSASRPGDWEQLMSSVT